MTDAEILDRITKLLRDHDTDHAASEEWVHRALLDGHFAVEVGLLLQYRQRGWKRIFKA